MTKIAFVIGVAAACSCGAAVSHSAATADIKAQLESLASVKSKSGGFVTKAGKGRFAIVSINRAYSIASIQRKAASLGGQFKFPMEATEYEGQIDILKMSSLKNDLGLTAVIFIINDETIPISLVAIEERWAVVNATRIVDASKPQSINDKRLNFEISRVAKALFSTVETARGKMAVSNGQDLDALSSDPIDSNSLVTIARGLPSYGLIAPKTVPYYRACREGWAPPPTNDVQRTIWNQVHQIPDKPVTIEFDPKKDK